MIAEACGTTHLIETGTGEESGSVYLVEVPAVQHVVECLVRGFDFQIAQFLVPVISDRVEFLVDGRKRECARCLVFVLDDSNDES